MYRGWCLEGFGDDLFLCDEDRGFKDRGDDDRGAGVHSGVFGLDGLDCFVDYACGVFGGENGGGLNYGGGLLDDYKRDAGVNDCYFLTGHLLIGSVGIFRRESWEVLTVWISVTGTYSVDVWEI